MGEAELSGIFGENSGQKLLVFTTRARRRDMKPFGPVDRLRFFLKSATRKLPGVLKYLPANYTEDPVIFATNLPGEMCSEYVRPLTRENYHAVIEASCLVPLAMGMPLLPKDLNQGSLAGDRGSVFLDGGFALKMPMRLFNEDPRFKDLGSWTSADKTIVFCCDPEGLLWESSARLRSLNAWPEVAEAVRKNRLFIIRPDHKVEAGFLCMDHATTMRTFGRGREQALRLLRSDPVRRFFNL
jgi:hypothetical protein